MGVREDSKEGTHVQEEHSKLSGLGGTLLPFAFHCANGEMDVKGSDVKSSNLAEAEE